MFHLVCQIGHYGDYWQNNLFRCQKMTKMKKKLNEKLSHHTKTLVGANVINTNLSCSRTEALRGGVVMGGGVVGSSGRGELECMADILIVPMCGPSVLLHNTMLKKKEKKKLPLTC